VGEREDGGWCRLGEIGRPGGAGMMEGGVGSLWAFGLPDPIGSGSSGNEKFG
jgi:hypothetical protein